VQLVLDQAPSFLEDRCSLRFLIHRFHESKAHSAPPNADLQAKKGIVLVMTEENKEVESNGNEQSQTPVDAAVPPLVTSGEAEEIVAHIDRGDDCLFHEVEGSIFRKVEF
jgi:hypothetical protein